MYTMVRFKCLGLLLLLATGCSGVLLGDVVDVSKLKPGYKVAVGKIDVINNSSVSDAAGKIRICFKSHVNDGTYCGFTRRYDKDEAGRDYVYLPLPQGKAEISRLSILGIKQSLDYEFSGLDFTLAENKTATYIGDIKVFLDKDNFALVKVNNNSKATIAAFKEASGLDSVSYSTDLIQELTIPIPGRRYKTYDPYMPDVHDNFNSGYGVRNSVL